MESGKRRSERLATDTREAKRLNRTRSREQRPSLLFPDVAEAWLQSRSKAKRRDSTIRSYEHALDRANQALASFRVDQVDGEAISEMQEMLERAGLATGTIRLVRKAVVSVLNYAVREGLLGKVPNLADVAQLGIEREQAKFIEPTQLERVFSFLPAKYQAPARFGYLTGLRPGELLGLQGEDVDLGAYPRVHIRRQMNTSEHRLEEVTKTEAGRRSVDLCPEAVELVRDVGPGRIWPFGYSAFLAAWRMAQLRAGLEPLGLHALRHTNVLLRLEDGQKLAYISRQLGHSSMRVTDKVYGHFSDLVRGRVATMGDTHARLVSAASD
jgi:integrase